MIPACPGGTSHHPHPQQAGGPTGQAGGPWLGVSERAPKLPHTVANEARDSSDETWD